VGPVVIPVIDTSILVRYLTQDDADMGAAAARLLDGEGDVGIGLVALAETAYVLTHHYGVPRSETVDCLVAVVRKRNIQVLGADRVLVADCLLLCRPSGRVSFADALILAEARSVGARTVWSFDARFPAAGITPRRPEGGPATDA